MMEDSGTGGWMTGKEMTITGKYAEAKVFLSDSEQYGIDQYAVAQIKMICDNEAAAGSKIRIMPDVHPGKVGPIGLTMTVQERILPALVGNDISCGITVAEIKNFHGDFSRLDAVIREKILSGFSLHRDNIVQDSFDYSYLLCGKHVQTERVDRSIGTLGSGNHFIEIDKSDDDRYYVLIHSGSRHLGQAVTEFYLREGQKRLKASGKKSLTS